MVNVTSNMAYIRILWDTLPLNFEIENTKETRLKLREATNSGLGDSKKGEIIQ